MVELEDIKQHLEELRKRLLRIVLVIGIVSVLIISLHAEPTQIEGFTIYYPTLDPLNNIAAQLTNYMKDNLVPEDVQLIQTSPGQAFFSQVYVAILAGVVIGMPVIIRELVQFIRPALKEREIHITRSITLPALGLFVGGCIFAYSIAIPYVLEVLYKYGESSGAITFLNIMVFVTFVLQFLLSFGFSFQLPLVMYAMTASGMINHDFWRKNVRYAIVAIVIFGAVVTPDGSGVTMWFVAGPMIALYAIGVIAIERKERQKLKT